MSHSHHHHDIDFKKAFSVTELPHSEVKISGEIPYEEVQKERSGAIKTLGQNVSIDGFRKGHAPEAMLVKHIGEMAILTEMAERAIGHMYPHVVEAHDLEVIGYPKIEITKIAPENPLGFTATVAVLPKVTLPDYKKIVKELNKDKASLTVTDEELDKKITDILRQKAAYERLQKKAAASVDVEGEPEVTETDTPEAELVPPPLTDEVAQSIGQPGQFADVADFKTKLREHLTIEKERDVTANHRATLTDKIIEGATIDLPAVLLDAELRQMSAQMEEDLTRAGLKLDDYLAHIKKTKEEILKDWTPTAEKRAKLQLILNEIAKIEKITADEKLVENQTKDLLEQYKDANADRVRTYVSTILQNEAVMKMLEEVK